MAQGDKRESDGDCSCLRPAPTCLDLVLARQWRQETASEAESSSRMRGWYGLAVHVARRTESGRINIGTLPSFSPTIPLRAHPSQSRPHLIRIFLLSKPLTRRSAVTKNYLAFELSADLSSSLEFEFSTLWQPEQVECQHHLTAQPSVESFTAASLVGNLDRDARKARLDEQSES